ncbi:MAG: patatin-like phospholipase family protein [Flavobacterium sp.]
MKHILLALSLSFLFSSSFAQENQDSLATPKTPIRVGLVLSGGGAKGFAHIGVLKVLEEANVKIDFIGGTSMGAIIGGLYASGYNAAQIDSIFRTTDFDALIQDQIPRSSKNYYIKRNDERYALSLPVDKFRIGVPTAYSKGLYNYNLLSKLLHSARDINDFSKLPIPFLCIATDIETGEEILLNKGYLPQAIAASAAFPSLFAPIEIDGRLLVDGGVKNNYPIDEVKKMGATFIIGVDVQDGLKTRENLNGATKILVQVSNLSMNEKMHEKIKETDIYIKPDIRDYGVISFAEGNQIIEKGSEAAQAVLERLKAVGTPGYVNHGKVEEHNAIIVDRINFNPLKNYTNAYVLGKLGIKDQESITYDELRSGVDNLAASRDFSTISYTIDHDQECGETINFKLTENKIKTYFKVGAHYDGLYKTGVLANLTRKKFLFKNDVLSLDAIVGDNIRYNFDYYIDNGFHFSFGVKSSFTTFSRNVGTDFSEGELLELLGVNSININFNDFSSSAYLQTIFAHKFVLGLGIEVKHLKIKSETLSNTSPDFDDSTYLSAFGYLKYDSYDNKFFPSSGWYVSGDFQYYHSSTDFSGKFLPFSIAKADAGYAYPISKNFSLNFQTEAGFKIGADSVPFFDFILGGYGFEPVNNVRSFYGFDFLSLSGDSYIKSTLTLDYNFFRKNHLNAGVNMASIADGLFSTPDWPSARKHLGYSVGYGLETILGPMEIKYTWSPELSKGFTFVAIGYTF